MRKLFFLFLISLIFILSSCGSGKKSDKPAKDSVAKSKSEISSWDLYKKYFTDFNKASGEKNIGKKFKISNLIVKSIQKNDDNSKEISCLAYNPANDSITAGKETKDTKYKLNNKDLKPVQFSYSFNIKLADAKDAENLKSFDDKELNNESIYTFFNIISIEGNLSEEGGNYLAFDKCKIIN